MKRRHALCAATKMAIRSIVSFRMFRRTNPKSMRNPDSNGSSRLQFFRLPFALRCDLESVSMFRGQGQPRLSDHRGIYALPVIHGNDRVEWFIQLSDEIHWEIADRDTGAPRARAVMKPGDVAAMPADIRHQGFGAQAFDVAGMGECGSVAARALREKEVEAEPGRFLARGANHLARLADRVGMAPLG